eukprot:gene1386-1726_t
MLLAAVQSQQESEQLGSLANQATPAESESADLLASASKETELNDTSVFLPASGETLPPSPSDFPAGFDPPAASAGTADAKPPTDAQQSGTTTPRRHKRARRRHSLTSTAAGNGPTSEAAVVAEATAAAVPAAITWNGDVGTGCDFRNQDMRSIAVATSNLCQTRCANTTGCTHFVWTRFNQGTCFLKNGSRSKADAIASGDSTMVCGLVIRWSGKNWANRCDFLGELLFLDEFTKLDQNLWNIDLGDGTDYGMPGWGNNELQCYTGSPNNLAIIPNPERQGDGLLKIRSVYSSTAHTCINKYAAPTSRQWTSAKITTSGKRTFTPKALNGVCSTVSMESRIKLANKRGHWEAFWSLGVTGSWPSCGEIDIMEHINENNQVLGTIHYANPSGGHQQLPNNNVIPLPPGANKDWNVYRVDWSCDSISYFVNNEKKYVIPKSQVNVWSFDQPFFLLLNMAVGGNLPGFDVDTAGGEMLVDYVKVYRT